ncbi:MAG: hypothetical protein KAR06_12755 [Deltaproteobacteria bacterium]|nr:hypothetical protein [Deltaproteobacteria bacterium]
MSDIIDMLKAKEAEVEAAIDQAQTKASEIKENTSAETRRIMDEAVERTVKEREEMNLAHQKQLQVKVEEIKAQGETKARTIQERSNERFEDAVKTVFETIASST